MIKSDNNLNLVILGSNGLAEEFSNNLKVIDFHFEKKFQILILNIQL